MQQRIAAALADIEASRHPLPALLSRLGAAVAAGDADSAALGVALLESVWHTLSPFPDAALLDAAARLYARLGRDDGALLLGGLAAQARAFPGRPAPAPDLPLGADAQAIVSHADPASALLHRLELLERGQDWEGSARLFASVWPRVPPLSEYWIYHRMAQVYAALGHGLAAALMAGMAAQIEPRDPVSDWPHRALLAWFIAEGRPRDAARLARRRAALCPSPELASPPELAAIFAAAGDLPPLADPSDRRVTLAHPMDIRAAQSWPCYGGDAPRSLAALRHGLRRHAVELVELRDAEVLLLDGSIAVHGADGTPHIDLSFGEYPSLARRRAERLREAGPAPAQGRALEELSLDTAVMMVDEFHTPNLCHFMLDHAPRLALYRQMGLDLGEVAVIGPILGQTYQRDILARMGVTAYLSTARRARVQVRRLVVSTTCRRLQHPAHWGADWAVATVRGLYDLAPRQPGRRLLVSRADSGQRRIANHAALEALLEEHGFTTICPGTLPFVEQREAFRDATHVVAPHGQGLANLLFCAPGTHVLEAFHPLYGTWAYAMIAPPLGLRYASLLARDALSDAPEHNDPDWPQAARNTHSGHDMRVDLGEVRRWLKDVGLC